MLQAVRTRARGAPHESEHGAMMRVRVSLSRHVRPALLAPRIGILDRTHCTALYGLCLARTLCARAVHLDVRPALLDGGCVGGCPSRVSWLLPALEVHVLRVLARPDNVARLELPQVATVAFREVYALHELGRRQCRARSHGTVALADRGRLKAVRLEQSTQRQTRVVDSLNLPSCCFDRLDGFLRRHLHLEADRRVERLVAAAEQFDTSVALAQRHQLRVEQIAHVDRTVLWQRQPTAPHGILQRPQVEVGILEARSPVAHLGQPLLQARRPTVLL
mmetsp:Transcript_24061/g.61454  ORF Transcript_24061/g.61454 Transcript_24061/m.61454 type:complete len:277 (+) Transcript_24061:283-1113(+)